MPVCCRLVLDSVSRTRPAPERVSGTGLVLGYFKPWHNCSHNLMITAPTLVNNQSRKSLWGSETQIYWIWPGCTYLVCTGLGLDQCFLDPLMAALTLMGSLSEPSQDHGAEATRVSRVELHIWLLPFVGGPSQDPVAEATGGSSGIIYLAPCPSSGCYLSVKKPSWEVYWTLFMGWVLSNLWKASSVPL